MIYDDDKRGLFNLLRQNVICQLISAFKTPEKTIVWNVLVIISKMNQSYMAQYEIKVLKYNDIRRLLQQVASC
jgi:hypothetical protein